MNTARRAALATLIVVASGLLGLSCSSSGNAEFVPNTGATATSTPTAARAEAALDRLIASGVPGGLVVVRSDDGEFAVSSGVADLDGDVALDVDTPVPLGGVTTSYLAAVMLQMADEGLLDLGESVEDHLPGLLDYGWDVAIYDLLQHIAGVPDYYGVGESPGVVVQRCQSDGVCELRAQDTIALVDELPSEFQPGEGWGWSNSDYRVAEMIAEEVAGTDWTEAVDERILQPLQLDATGSPDEWSEVAGLAHGYSDLDGDGVIEDVTGLLPYGAGANGAMVATTSDLLDFMEPLLDGSLLSPSADVALFAAAPTGYGHEEYGHGVFFPEGGTGSLAAAAGEALGYSIYVEHNRDTGTTTAIVLNRSGGIDPGLWGDLVTAATDRDSCDARDRGTTVPGGLRLYCRQEAPGPGQSTR